MNMKTLGIAVLAASLGLSVSADVVYLEDFQKLGDYAPGVTRLEGQIGIDNEPCWEQYFALWVRPKQDVAVWENGIPVAKGDFDVGFEFKNASERGFDLVMGSAKFAVTNGFKDGWSALQLKGRGGKGELWVMKNRAYEKIASGLNVAGLTSVNVLAHEKTNLAIKNVCSETARDGFQVDSSVKRLFADFASLEQPFDGTACAAETTVTMPEAPRAKIRLQLGKGAISSVYEEFDKKTGAASLVTKPFSVGAINEHKRMWGDAILKMPGLADRYVRPHHWPFGLRCFYGDKIPQYVDLLREWDTLPGASNHVVTVEFVRVKDGQQIWVDGSYVKTTKSVKPFAFVLKDGAKYALSTPETEDTQFVKLDFAANPKAKAFAKAEFKGLKAGRTKFGGGLFGGGTPVDVAAPIDSQDIAICHQAKGAWALEVEEYFSGNRSPLTGYPSESHFLVPGATYSKVAFLFALDPDPKKDAVLTVTFGRYEGEIGGNKLTQETWDFTGGVPEWCKKVGEVVKDGKALPVYYAERPVDLGKIIDFTDAKPMDVEFTGKRWVNFQQDDKSMRPTPYSDSAVTLFGATLVKAGYNVATVMSAPGNVYTKDAKARKTALEVTGTFGGKGTVVATVTDTDEQVVKTVEKSFKVGAGEKALVELDYGDLDSGWYQLVWTVKEGDAAVLNHRGALAVVPEAGRLVSKEKSPYATWLFMGTHGAPTNKPWAGQLMQMAGIRKSGLEKKWADQYDHTSIGSAYAPHFREFGKTNYEEIVVKGIEKTLKEKPFVDHVMIWHESAPGGADQYYEVLGLPVTMDEKRTAFCKRVANYISETGRIVHKHFPGLKLQIGNSSIPMGAVTYTMRGGVDWSVFDSIGLEAPSQMVPPERYTEIGLLGLFGPQTLASKAAGRKIPCNGCYEFIYRSERDIGQELQGQYQARDVAICLAHDFTLISPGIFFDCSAGYYNGLWGGSGIMERGPWCYPKRAYVAYAVATKVLDGAKFVRALDTGSSTVYALEYKRLDGKTVTCVWCVRGTFDFDFDGKAELVSLYGGKGEKKGSGRMTYVVTDRPLAGFKVSNRAFPFEDGLFKDAPVVCDLAGAKYTVEPDPGVASTTHSFMPQLKPGTFEVKAAKDAAKGDCLEVTLKSDPKKTTSFWTEYTTIRFAEPVAIPGEPSLLAVETMGNSNWGQFRFEIEDADGEVFKNVSTGAGWGCDIMDWPGRLAVAFDGWSWVCQSLKKNSLLPDHSPGDYSEQWQSQGGDKKIKYPIKLRAITVGMNRDKTNIFGFEPATPSIRIKSVRAR